MKNLMQKQHKSHGTRTRGFCVFIIKLTAPPHRQNSSPEPLRSSQRPYSNNMQTNYKPDIKSSLKEKIYRLLKVKKLIGFIKNLLVPISFLFVN